MADGAGGGVDAEEVDTGGQGADVEGGLACVGFCKGGHHAAYGIDDVDARHGQGGGYLHQVAGGVGRESNLRPGNGVVYPVAEELEAHTHAAGVDEGGVEAVVLVTAQALHLGPVEDVRKEVLQQERGVGGLSDEGGVGPFDGYAVAVARAAVPSQGRPCVAALGEVQPRRLPAPRPVGL